MSTTTAILIGVIILVVAGAIAMLVTRRRSERLRSRFGPEYDRTVEESGGRTAAEARLERLQRRVESYHIHPVPAASRGRYLEDWKRVQAEFVDDPEGALDHAHALIDEVMGASGYPMSEFDQRAEDLSVDHPQVVANYRAAHDIAVRHGKGETNTEDLRQAMVHYRALFDDLVGEPEPAARRRSTAEGAASSAPYTN